ncbi:MAG: FtsW/RodA/SpoVE family cell cycle protein [Victivallales bacterium]|nr:FtsW/RodA/SpoVE family cell cycle protein [Victivallales bacterium]
MTETSPSRVLTILVMVLLAAFGVCYIFSTGYLGSSYPIRPNWLRQCAFLGLGTIAATMMARLDNRGTLWRTVVWTGYGVSVLLLAVVLLCGREIGGARRWLALGPFLLQPAEFAKVFTILAGSLLLSGDVCKNRRQELGWTLLCFAVPFGLILLEPSYGNACSLLPCLLTILGIRFCPNWLWRICLMALVACLLAGAYCVFQLRSQPPEAQEVSMVVEGGRGFLRGYHLRRLRAFLSPEGDWNEQQSLITVAGGGLTGKGYLNGTMKRLGFLPRTVAPTDFIFAVIAEEGGLLFGVVPVLLLYALLIGLLLHRATDVACRLDLNLLAAGTMLLFVHILVGVGMTVRLVPVIGLPLPLLSYGGSFTMSILILLGTLLGTRQTSLADEDDTPMVPAQSRILRFGPLLRIGVRWK